MRESPDAVAEPEGGGTAKLSACSSTAGDKAALPARAYGWVWVT